MKALIDYIETHTARGECQCGRCFDKQPDREAPKHSIDVHFFWVAGTNSPEKSELVPLILSNYPDIERLKGGPSYIEIGGVLGDQGIALRFMGLGEILGVWNVITPKFLAADGEAAEKLAGAGFVMIDGFRPGEVGANA